MSRSFVLKKIRLLNFHNFIDETINLNGHLFLLGGNGSGKTTILDSVHFALTAGGQRMELNSAARMGEHTRNLGRTLQGIFLRYDLEKGQRNKDKTIGYVCLEFAKPGSEERFCIGCGAFATSMQAAPQIWGFEAAVSLDKLILTETVGGEKLPINQEGLKNSGYKVYSRERYIEVIAAKFFDSAESYRETMKLIAAGKSYRELVSRIKDQSQLFRELLPPPDASVYQKIQKSLQEIERIQENLKDQKNRLDSLGALKVDLDESLKAREKVARLAYMNAFQKLESTRIALTAETDKKKRAKSDLLQKQSEMKLLADEIGQLEARIEADKNSSLYRDQQLLIEIKREFERNSIRQKEVEKRLAAHRSEIEKLSLKAKETADAIEDSWQNLESRFSEIAALPDAGELTTDRTIEAYNSEYERLSKFLSDRCAALNNELAACEYQQKQIEAGISARTREIIALKKQKEAFPDADGFESLEARLAAEKISFLPLFRMLEPANDMTGPVARIIEEIIGPRRLCTLFVAEASHKKARAEVVAEPFNIAVYSEREQREPAVLPGGLRRFLRFSGEHAVQAENYVARLLDKFRYVVGEDAFWKSSEDNLVCSNGLTRENGTVRRVEASSNRYIGSAAREAMRQAQIDEVEGKKYELELDLKSKTEKLVVIRGLLSSARRSSDSLTRFPPSSFRRLNQEYFEINDRIRIVTGSIADEEKGLEELAGEQMARQEKIRAGEERLQDTDFAALNARINADAARKKECERQLKACTESEVASRISLEYAEKEYARLEILLKNREEGLKQQQNQLLALQPDLAEADLHHFVYVTSRGQQIKTENLDGNLRGAESDLAAKRQTIINRLQFDTALGRITQFAFNEETFSICNAAGKSLQTIRAEMQEKYDESSGILQKENRELFEKLIINDTVRRLCTEEEALKKTIESMNRLLGGLKFGNTTYRFRTQLREEFKEFRGLVHKVSDTDQETREQLKNYFEAHRSLLVREGDNIPDFLDYRKWHDVELQASTDGGKGVTLDRNRISMGSGGEQSVPNYILLLSLAKVHLDHTGSRIRLILMDEAFYGIDAQRREQLLNFADMIDIGLIIAHPDLDGVTESLANSTTLLVEKTVEGDVYLGQFDFTRKTPARLFDGPTSEKPAVISLNG